ncbi:reverse transcriptase domain-containing protein [Tanacetum coccineum]
MMAGMYYGICTANVGLVYWTYHGNHVDVIGFVDSNNAEDLDKGRSMVVQIVLWYLDSGCSKHMTGNRSQLMNFIHRSPHGIFISQSQCTLELLKKHGMDGCDSISTPMATARLDADLQVTPTDQIKYRSMIGGLMYLTASRPDIAFVTFVCARYHARPTVKHLKEVKRIFQYLRQTYNMGLWYPKDSGFELIAYSDVDHAGCHDGGKSTLVGLQLLGKKLVSWSSKKQDGTTMSTVEAEYVSLSACCAQFIWMRIQLLDYEYRFNKIPMYFDSKSVIAISCNLCMQTRSSSKFVSEPSTNPTSTNLKRRNRRRSKQRFELFALEEAPVVTMADQRTMAELLRAPTEGYAEAIVVPPIPAEHFELKHSLISLVTSKQFFGFEDPHAHIRYFNKITSTLKYKDVPEASIKLMIFPFYIDGPARIWLDKEPPRYILTWDDLVSKFINHFFPPSKTTNLRNEISNFNQKFEETFSEAWDRFKDLLRACPHHVKTSNVDSSEIASVVASVVTSAMTAMFKQHQVTPAPASVKAVEESCVTCGNAHSYRQCPATDGNTFSGYHDNIQGYVSAVVVNYNQGNTGYRPPSVANQTQPPGFAQPYKQNNQNRYNQGYNQNRGNSNYQTPTQQTQVITLSELEKFKKTNEASMQAMRNHIGNLKSKLRNEMQATMSNQTNELKNMMASFFQMNTASSSGSGSLPSNTIANPKGELKANTTRSGIVLDGPSVPTPFINPEEEERVEETLTDPELVEYTVKVPPPLVQKPQAPSQKYYEMPKRDPLHPNISYPSRMNKEKQQDKDEIQIHKFWQMFKQLDPRELTPFNMYQ